ncbi:hypothetical protein E0H77_12510 [Acinetobacter sp. ANC 4633]|nr:hypothetical protein E0H77_12510 [Acinetobacter sp. ANC 4633]
MTASGPAPTPATTLLTNLLAYVASTNPDYTANLPGTLIEDISSTDVGAMLMIDQAVVDLVSRVSPYAAPPFILAQMGAMFGIPQGQPTNTSVYVVFEGLPGFVVQQGFIVGDGTNQYVVQDGAIIGSSGLSQPVYCVANQAGSWAVPVNTVNQVITSVPSGYTLTVNNTSTGTTGTGAEQVNSYRSRIWQAWNKTGHGTPAYIKSLLEAILNPRLISIIQNGANWEVICGGGDPYAIAGAIYLGAMDINNFVGSATTARNITVSVTDAPNSYNITFVNPPQQTVTASVVWNTDLPNFTGSSAVNQLASVALVNYLNSIVVGQAINILQMQAIFQESVASILPQQYLSTLTFQIYINGVLTPPSAGTQLVTGDPESYFFCPATGVSVAQ